MATSKKAAPKKAAKKKVTKNRARKHSFPVVKQIKEGFKRSIEPINLGNAIQQPMPNAQQVFDGLKNQSDNVDLVADQPIKANLHSDSFVQKDIQSYLDYKAVNPGSVQGQSFASYVSYKRQGMLEPALYNSSSKIQALSSGHPDLTNTDTAYLAVVDTCMKTFAEKLSDYGASWRIFRLKSISDQIFIKANRIRTIQEAGMQMIGDTIQSEYLGIVNYGIIALIQMKLMPTIEEEDNHEGIGNMYDIFMEKCFSTMREKNHDYGESWKYLQAESFCDIILVRLKRIQQIEGNAGKVQYSEPLDQNFIDIINYAIFALIRYNEKSFS